MSRRAAAEPQSDEQQADLAYLVQPAKDLVANFDIPLLTKLASYLETIDKESSSGGNDQQNASNPTPRDVAAIYKLFNFQRACRVIQGSVAVLARKVDHVYDLTLSISDLVDNNQDGADGGGGARGRRGGARRQVCLGSTDYGLMDIKEIKREALENYEKAVKEEKKAIDILRSVDKAELREQLFERRNCIVAKPTQFMFKLDYGQLNRTDEQIYNAKSRPEIIGKVKDFDVKKAEIIHSQQVLYSHDCYKENLDEFTLPGARWIPDNKELATNFGVPDVEVELDQEQAKEKIDAYGPFKDPLSGRQVVAPPRWFIEKEAERQHQEILSRATSRASRGLRESQGLPLSQPSQRYSQPLIEGRRKLTDLVSFVDHQMLKNRPSTRLTTGGLVDMIVNNLGADNDPFGDGGEGGGANYSMGGANYDMDDMDYGGGGGGAMDDDNDSNDYVGNLTRRQQQKPRRTGPAFWDDLEKIRIPMYTGDEDYIPTTRKPIKTVTKTPLAPTEILRRKRRREAKTAPSRRDEFMQTHDYLQDYYYWRSAARINPNKDWKVEALRASILAEKKRRIKAKTTKIREIRAKNARRPTRASRGIPVEEYEAALDDMVPQGNRRTMGMEYDDVVDDDLAAEVELDEFGAGGGGADYDDFDVAPQGENGPPPGAADDYQNNIDYDAVMADGPVSTYKPMKFSEINDDELDNCIHLTGNVFIDKALPILRRFTDNKTDRESMAYAMAKAYEDVDVAVSTLQEHVDQWHAKLEPILDEGETRKEYDVNQVGRAVLAKYSHPGETQRLLDLVVGHPWFEISRYFLACLFMCNQGNVAISDDVDVDSLEDKVNTMRITFLNDEMHYEKMKQAGAFGGPTN